MKCSVNGCEQDRFRSQDYCRKHYRWLTERGSLEPTHHSQGPLEFRFWAKVEKLGPTECWFWRGSKNERGYGHIADYRNGKRINCLAHRVSYRLHRGDLQDGDYVLHSCDNPSCVNPAHLRRGTMSENIKEAYQKGRKVQPIRFGEANPKSKLTLKQVRYIKAHPELRHTDLADKFHVSPNAVRSVRVGRTWRDT